jgi:predicted DsbA family dithiol-disulfide isomerase
VAEGLGLGLQNGGRRPRTIRELLKAGEALGQEAGQEMAEKNLQAYFEEEPLKNE